MLVKLTVPFAQVPNELLCDSELTADAKALWAYMQSKPDGWDFSADRIQDDFKEGRKVILGALNLLEETGWLKRSRVTNGRMKYELLLPSIPLPTVPIRHCVKKGLISNKEIKEIKNVSQSETSSFEDNSSSGPGGEVNLVPCDDWGEEVEIKRPPKDPRTDAAINHFKKTVLKDLGSRPAVSLAVARKMVNNALQHLTPEQLNDHISDWTSMGLPDNETMQITRCLSTAQINRYKAEHGIR